ncbi:PRP2, partial [Symbiodinium sp. KB8]
NAHPSRAGGGSFDRQRWTSLCCGARNSGGPSGRWATGSLRAWPGLQRGRLSGHRARGRAFQAHRHGSDPSASDQGPWWALRDCAASAGPKIAFRGEARSAAVERRPCSRAGSGGKTSATDPGVALARIVC